MTDEGLISLYSVDHPPDKSWLVYYSVKGCTDQVRGYDTEEEALRNMRDIEGYEGVSNVSIKDNRPTLLQLLCSEP